MMLIGIGALVGGLQYRMGTLARKGAGYYPVLLGALLILVSAFILATPSFEPGSTDSQPQDRSWSLRPWACVIAGLLLFIGLGQYGGLVPATFAIVTV